MSTNCHCAKHYQGAIIVYCWCYLLFDSGIVGLKPDSKGLVIICGQGKRNQNDFHQKSFYGPLSAQRIFFFDAHSLDLKIFSTPSPQLLTANPAMIHNDQSLNGYIM